MCTFTRLALMIFCLLSFYPFNLLSFYPFIFLSFYRCSYLRSHVYRSHPSFALATAVLQYSLELDAAWL